MTNYKVLAEASVYKPHRLWIEEVAFAQASLKEEIDDFVVEMLRLEFSKDEIKEEIDEIFGELIR